MIQQDNLFQALFVEESCQTTDKNDKTNECCKCCKENTKRIKKLEIMLKEQNEMLAKQMLLLQPLYENAFPNKPVLEIFPINSIQELEEYSNIQKYEAIAYIRQVIGTLPLQKCIHKFFSVPFLFDINWDGMQKKIAAKNFKFFNTYLFDAVKNENYSFNNFESDMRKGFRLAKNRYYRIKHEIKKGIINK